MSLTLITGPMFSGKTSYLLSAINKYAIVRKRVLCVNHSFDRRYDSEGKIHSHDGKSVYITEKNKDFIKQVSTESISELLDNENIQDYSAIFIDEGHFYKDITDVSKIIQMKKNVYISFLNSDYKMCNFTVMDPLYSKADKIVHLVAVCNVCGSDAPFTTRLSREDNSQILVGADDVYEPRCRACFTV